MRKPLIKAYPVGRYAKETIAALWAVELAAGIHPFLSKPYAKKTKQLPGA